MTKKHRPPTWHRPQQEHNHKTVQKTASTKKAQSQAGIHWDSQQVGCVTFQALLPVILHHGASVAIPAFQKWEHHWLCPFFSQYKLEDQHLEELLSVEIPIHFPHTFSYHSTSKWHSSPVSLPLSCLTPQLSIVTQHCNSALLTNSACIPPSQQFVP